MEYYAHSLEGRPISEWHRLEEHLIGTEGTVPDLRTDVGAGLVPALVESGLSPVKRGMGISGRVVVEKE